MEEIIASLHMHTVYSDGHATHREIAEAALNAGIDVVIVTDHNVYVEGPEGYYPRAEQRVLMLVGEEIHDPVRVPQKNHLLAWGHNRELCELAADTQRLLDAIRQAGGVSFIAHPYDPEAPAVGEDDLSWVDWNVQGYTGIELWNAMSEFKSLLHSKWHAVYYAFNPNRIASGPFPSVLKIWDDLLAAGGRVTAVGGADAHALPARLGPLRRTLFPYEDHFRGITTHLLIERPLTGELESDRRMVLDAFRSGRAFVGYDLPAPTKGFRFTASGYEQNARMGDDISAVRGVTFQIRLPQSAECRLVRHGEVVQEWRGQQHCMYVTSKPGAYRVEAYLDYQGKRRGWIFSNPIYVKGK